MKKIVLLAALLALASVPARADYVIKDGNNVLKTIKAGTLAGSVILPYQVPVDASGLPFGTLNPLPVMFGYGILLPSFATPQHFICDSGCSGGGGGGGLSVTFGGGIGTLGTPVGFKDGSGNFQPLLGDVTNGQWVNIKASVPIAVTGTFFQATQPVSGTVTANLGTIGTAATAANQTTGNSSLSSIDGKTPVLGQALAAASVPVVLPAAQLATLTPLTSVTVTQGTGTNLHMVCDSGCSSSSSPSFGVTFPSTGTPIGMSQGGNMVALTGTSGNLNVNIASGAVTGLAQGSATSGQLGGLMMGAVTTAAPSYTTAQTSPLSLTLAGALRTDNAVIGAQADAVCGTPTGTCSEIALLKYLNNSVNAPPPLNVNTVSTAWTGLTPGVAQTGAIIAGNVDVSSFKGTAVDVNSGNKSAGTQRGVLATDQLALPAWGHGATAAAVPAGATYVGMAQSGNLVGLTGTSGNLNVQCANCSGSGVSTADAAVFTASSSLFAGSGGFFQTTATNNPLTTGQQGMFQVTAQRALFTNLRNASGTEVGTSAAEFFIGGRGTAGSAAGGVLTVQGSASGTAIPVSLSSTTITGTVAATQSGSWTLAANQSVNVAQINGVTPLMGNGVTGTGSQRVTVASDNTPFAVKIDQTTPGTTNLVSIGTNGTVNPQTPANWGIGTTTQNSASVANGQMALGQFNTTPTTITPGNMSPLQMDNAGRLLVNVQSALGLAAGSTTSGQTGSMVMAATTAANPSNTTAQTNYLSADVKGNLRTVLGGGTPITATAVGTTGATTATLATSASVTTYICGFSIRANATAAATGNATVTGVITGTMNFTQWTAPNASGLGVTEELFSPCIPASAANTSIAVVSAAPGTSGVVSVSAWGYQQ